MLLVWLIYNLSARGAASRRWKFPIFWERAKCTMLNRRRWINVDARSNRKSSTCSRNSSQIARAILTSTRNRRDSADVLFLTQVTKYVKIAGIPAIFAPKAASLIIHDPDVTPWIDVKTAKIQDSRRAGIADSWMRRTNCQLLTFRRTILSLIIYDPDVIAMKSFGHIDYSIAVRI